MLREIVDILQTVRRGRFTELLRNRLFRIALVGTCGFVLQVTFFEVAAIQFGFLRPSTAAAVGAELGIILNFFLHNRFSFADRQIPISRGVWKKFIQFNAVVLLSLAIQWVMVFLAESFAGESNLILRLANFAGVVLGFIANYLSYTKIIWRTGAPQPPAA